jgi:predicted CxxxxCH...CXXCH cytochrome family protein
VQAEVLFSPLDPGTNYSVTAFTCTTSYCHGSGVTAKTSPVWTSTTALACVDGCHGGDPSRTGMPSGHRRRAPRQRRQGRPVLRRRLELQPGEQVVHRDRKRLPRQGHAERLVGWAAATRRRNRRRRASIWSRKTELPGAGDDRYSATIAAARASLLAARIEIESR